MVNFEGKTANMPVTENTKQDFHSELYSFDGVDVGFDNDGHLSVISRTVSEGGREMLIMIGRSGFANIIGETAPETMWPTPEIVDAVVNEAISKLPEEKKGEVQKWYESTSKKIVNFYEQNKRNSEELLRK